MSLCAEGLPNTEIGRRIGMTRQTVIAWRARYEAGGSTRSPTLPRSGRLQVIDEPAVIASTLNRHPRSWP
jgi:transposase